MDEGKGRVRALNASLKSDAARTKRMAAMRAIQFIVQCPRRNPAIQGRTRRRSAQSVIISIKSAGMALGHHGFPLRLSQTVSVRSVKAASS